MLSSVDSPTLSDTRPHLSGAGARSRGFRAPAALRNPALYFLIPAFLFLAALSVYPLLELIRMSVSTVQPATLLRDWPFAGLANFQAVINSRSFGQALSNTVLFVGAVLVITLIGGLVAALLLKRPTRSAIITQSLMVFVWALPPVVTGGLWKFLFAGNGLVNVTLQRLGMKGEILWIADPAWRCGPSSS